ncbi:PRC-barrel domain-containing protein [Marinicrinis sediminis]|uniref:PRC-barrel domain-containing protein n=1 Tax=Marinicrinis sediminis TaxID=1652465 RepID=A0ABW5R6N4_9BACL
MLQAHQIRGLPILDVETGKELGTCKDILISKEFKAAGMLIDAKRWLSAPRMIRMDALLSIGDDAVMLPNADVIQPWKEELHGDWLCSQHFKGLPVYTSNGHQLGTIEDVYFSKDSDKDIVGLELTDGFLSDIQEGRSWLPIQTPMRIGEDAVIVSSVSEQDVKKIVTNQ